MQVQENIDLRRHSTMKLGGRARYFAQADSLGRIKELIDFAKHKDVPFIVIGQGSNIVWRDEGFKGLVIANQITGIDVLSEDADALTARISSGEIWDKVVEWSVGKGLSGIEFLSRIPGLAGAAPVQNIGAYGAELADVFVELEAYDTKEDKLVKLAKDGCGFGYRTSRFKKADRGRFIILGITLKLNKDKPRPPFYESLENYFKERGIKERTPQNIRDAVTAIRKIKLPDPSVVPNNGSFFTNPIVSVQKYKELKKKYPNIKAWGKDDKVKLAAGWMVEQAGFKDYHDGQTGMGTWWGSALVLINEHAQKTTDLLEFRQKIIFKVDELFGVVLEQEPELLPA